MWVPIDPQKEIVKKKQNEGPNRWATDPPPIISNDKKSKLPRTKWKQLRTNRIEQTHPEFPQTRFYQLGQLTFLTKKNENPKNIRDVYCYQPDQQRILMTCERKSGCHILSFAIKLTHSTFPADTQHQSHSNFLHVVSDVIFTKCEWRSGIASNKWVWFLRWNAWNCFCANGWHFTFVCRRVF